MSLFDNLIALVVPHACLGCSEEGSLLCVRCLNGLPKVPERCYRCHKVSDDSLTCSACRKTSRLCRVQVVTVYAEPAKELVWKLKFGGAQAASQPIVSRMAQIVGRQPASVVIVPVPTATGRVRRRGYDQAELLARALARQSLQPYKPWLVRIGQQHQVGSNRQQRLRQLASAFRVKRSGHLKGAHILLVDDVLTTGATLEAAARALKVAGAERVDAVVFAQA